MSGVGAVPLVRSLLGHAAKQADQAPFAAGVLTAITGLTVTDTFDGGQVLATCNIQARTDVALSVCLLQINLDGAMVHQRGLYFPSAGADYDKLLVAPITPTPGVHTINVTGYAFSGNTTIKAAATSESFLRVTRAV